MYCYTNPLIFHYKKLLLNGCYYQSCCISDVAQVRSLNFERLVGGGVLHTKYWMVDRKHVYIGSANTDWRSLAQVKEMGVYIQNCPCVVQDVAKIFDVSNTLSGWNLQQD